MPTKIHRYDKPVLGVISVIIVKAHTVSYTINNSLNLVNEREKGGNKIHHYTYHHIKLVMF